MGAVSLRLPDDVAGRLQSLSAQTGRSKTFYMIEAIRTHLDDLEELYLAERRLQANREGQSATMSLDEVERLLGVDD